MTKEQILERLLAKVGDGLWVLATLMKAGRPINKERLKELTNQHFSIKNHDAELPIRSRHTLDQIAARLEGAGLVDIQVIGRTRMYQLSELGYEPESVSMNLVKLHSCNFMVNRGTERTVYSLRLALGSLRNSGADGFACF